MDDGFDEGGKKRIVGAAESDFIYACLEQGNDYPLDAGEGFGRIDIAALYTVNPVLRVNGQHLNRLRKFVAGVGKESAVKGAACGEDSDFAGAGRGCRRFDGGFHADEMGVGKRFAERIERGGGRGIAGDDNDAAMFSDKELRDARGKGNDFLRGARTVGTVFLVGEIDEVVLGQFTRDRAQDG